MRRRAPAMAMTRVRTVVGALFGRTPSPPTVVAPAPPLPRAWHDEIAHRLLPQYALANADTLFRDDAGADAVPAWLYDMFVEAGQRHGLGFDASMDAADEARFLRHEAVGVRIAAVIMPPPLTTGEAHLVLLAHRDGGAARCFALDRADEGTNLVSFGADGTRTSLGAGPAPMPDAVIAAIVAHLPD